MPHRYFTTEISNGTATLRGADAHHLSRVMRGRLGDTVILCDGNAVEYTATITGFGPETVEFSVEPGYPSAAEPSVEVTLFVGYPKQDKLEQVIRHGVELGCTHFVPFFSRYCVAAPKKEEQKNERYNRIAFEAAKQGDIRQHAPAQLRGPLPQSGRVRPRALLLRAGRRAPAPAAGRRTACRRPAAEDRPHHRCRGRLCRGRG